MDRFIADMWDRTPMKPTVRFLAPVDAGLGFSPDNVEWQFRKVRPRKGLKGKRCFPRTLTKLDWPFRIMQLLH